jgi:hypothetical protein
MCVQDSGKNNYRKLYYILLLNLISEACTDLYQKTFYVDYLF